MKPLLSEYMEGLAKTKQAVTVIIKGERTVEGHIYGIDKHMNILLRESVETRVQKGCYGKGVKRRDEKTFKRELGNVFIRGGTVIAIHVK